ncbi:hypothetical protein PXJ20_26885 [Paraburkholderia sp. A1RI_3L]|uniref:hypothetical protein n=1 Tax=Paraburkholderia TaxID=1822464 RepID=UPI0020CFF065|nr:hypothetical protein [Paraburkholderia kururiensis]
MTAGLSGAFREPARWGFVPAGDTPSGSFPLRQKMSYFQMIVGKRFTIVATDGNRPVCKSEAVAFDVFDRNACRTVAEGQPFEAAFDFCTARLAIKAARPLQ